MAPGETALAPSAGETSAPLTRPLERYGYTKQKLSRIVRAHKSYFDSRKTKDDKRREEFFNPADENSDTAKANFCFARVAVLLSILYTRAPKKQIEPRTAAGGGQEFVQQLMAAGLLDEPNIGLARRKYADAAETYLDFSFDFTDAGDHVEQCIQEGEITGMGALKHSFDNELQLERWDCLQAHEVYFDPEARFNLKQCKYVSFVATMEISAARKFFTAKVDALKTYPEIAAGTAAPQVPESNVFNLNPNFDPMKIEANETLEEAVSDSKARDETGEGKEFLRFYELWTLEDGQRWKYYTTHDGSFDFREPWPYQLRTYDHSLSIYVPYRMGKRLDDGFPTQAVIAGLDKLRHLCVEFLQRYQRRAIGKVVIYDKTKIDATSIEKVKSGGELVFLGLEGIKPEDIEKLFHTVNFNEGDEVFQEFLRELKEWEDEISGNDELVRGADIKSGTTAKEVEVRDDMSQVRTKRKQGRIDSFLNDALIKRFCIARQKTPPEKVAKIAGDAAGLMWKLHASSPDDLCCEYDISVTAGSTAQRHKEDEVENLDKVTERMDWANQRLMAMNQPPRFDVIEPVKELISKLVRNVERYELKPGDPAQGQQPGMPGMVPGAAADPRSAAVPQAAPAGAPNIPAPAGQPMVQR